MLLDRKKMMRTINPRVRTARPRLYVLNIWSDIEIEAGQADVPTAKRFSGLSIAGDPGRTLGAAAGAAGISSHGDGLLVLLHVLEEGNSALQLPAINGLGGLAGVLEGNSQVGTAGAGRLGGLDLGRGVSNLFFAENQLVSRRSVAIASIPQSPILNR